MSIKNLPEATEPEVITEETSDLALLTEQYNATKTSASSAVSSLIGDFTLAGMDNVNELVSEAMQKVKQFVDNGTPKSTTSKITGSFLAVVDPNNKWAGKWLNNAKDTLEEEKRKEQSIDQVINTLTSQIMKKRDEVITFIEEGLVVKRKMIDDAETYRQLLEKTDAIVAAGDENNPRKIHDAKLLSNKLRTSIEHLAISLKSQVTPLIGSANIICDEIAATLPTIETDLKYTAGFKAFEQKISDLSGMTKTIVALASDANDIMRKDTNETVCETLSLIGNIGIDETRLQKVYSEQKLHDTKVAQLMDATQTKMENTYIALKKHHETHEKEREQNTQNLLGVYSDVTEADTEAV